MARAGVARPPAVSARAIQPCAAAPPGVCTRMATSRLSTRSLARQVVMAPLAVISAGPTWSRGRYRSGRPTAVDVIDAADLPFAPVRGPLPWSAMCRSPPPEPGPGGCQRLPELRDAGDRGSGECRGTDHHGTDHQDHERARARG